MRLKGFSFVELLLATSLIAFSATALITLQTHLAQMDEELTLRAHAWYLAQEKLDDLSDFQALQTSTMAAGSFQQIATNTGGTLLAGQLQLLVSATTSVGFHRSWQVRNLFFIDSTGNGVANGWVEQSQLPAGHVAINGVAHAKQVVVTVSWRDRVGSLRWVDAEGVIAPLLATNAAAALN